MISPYWYKIEFTFKSWLQLFKALQYFTFVLMFKNFIGRNIPTPPAEMRCLSGFLAGPGRTGDCLDMHIGIQ